MTSDNSQFDPRANIDAEIRHISDDRLGRAPFARRVTARIADAGDRPSIVYGLAGPWGGGKSSVLNMVEELLTEEHGSKWTVVRFAPWAAADVEALTDEFYRAIAEAMPDDTEEGKRARRLLLAAAPVAIATVKAAAKALIESKLGKDSTAEIAKAATDAVADEFGEIAVEPDPFVKRFIKLSDAIKQAGRNILVIVDDIDRLHADELLSVMKSVRLLGRFDRVHYFLSYDEDTVLAVLKGSALAKDDHKRARQYLEKIVQYPFVLPPLDPVRLESELATVLAVVSEVHGIELDTDSPGKESVISRIIDAIPDIDFEELTPRFIYRFASQVDMLLALVGKEEVNFKDAALITYLRMRQDALYKQLPRWRADLPGEPRTLTGPRTEPDQAEWRRRLSEVLGQSIGPQYVESMLQFLGKLFPRVAGRALYEPTPSERRICEPDYFSRYFAYGIPVNDVHDAKVREEFATLLVSSSLPIDSVILENLSSFLGRGLVRRKIIRNLDVVATATSAAAEEAAHYITRILSDEDQDFGGWGVIIYALLGYAISVAEDDAAARAIADAFLAEFGLLTAVRTLSQRVSLLVPIDQSKIIRASGSLREAVLEVCKADLTRDVLAEDPESLTILHFLYSIDQELWGELSIFAVSELIGKSHAKPYELAARFVRIRANARDIQWQREEYLEQFAIVVPHEYWAVNQIPQISESDISVGDMSLENRAKFAALLMKPIADALLRETEEAGNLPAAAKQAEEATDSVSADENIAAVDESRQISESSDQALRIGFVRAPVFQGRQGWMVRNESDLSVASVQVTSTTGSPLAVHRPSGTEHVSHYDEPVLGASESTRSFELVSLQAGRSQIEQMRLTFTDAQGVPWERIGTQTPTKGAAPAG
jgi:KAP family P-loop domain